MLLLKLIVNILCSFGYYWVCKYMLFFLNNYLFCIQFYPTGLDGVKLYQTFAHNAKILQSDLYGFGSFVLKLLKISNSAFCTGMRTEQIAHKRSETTLKSTGADNEKLGHIFAVSLSQSWVTAYLTQGRS